MSTTKRWHPVNSAKNAPLVVQINDTITGHRHVVPSAADEAAGYFDEAPADVVYGSTTLHDLIKMVKKDIPALYLCDQIGGAVLTCGRRQVVKDEWESTMLWELIREEGGAGTVPWVRLEDGREAVVVTIGNEEKPMRRQPDVIHRILSKGNRTPSLDLIPEKKPSTDCVKIVPIFVHRG